MDRVLEAEIGRSYIAKIMLISLMNYNEKNPATPADIRRELPSEQLKTEPTFYYWLNKLHDGKYLEKDPITRKHTFYWLTDKGIKLVDKMKPRSKDALLDFITETLVRYKQTDKPKDFVKSRLEELYNSM